MDLGCGIRVIAGMFAYSGGAQPNFRGGDLNRNTFHQNGISVIGCAVYRLYLLFYPLLSDSEAGPRAEGAPIGFCRRG